MILEILKELTAINEVLLWGTLEERIMASERLEVVMEKLRRLM